MGYMLLVTLIVTVMLIVVQRTEKSRRRLSMFIALLIMFGLIYNMTLKDLYAETILGFILGIFMSGLFWLLIGRYNPVGSSDENIKVYGMDD